MENVYYSFNTLSDEDIISENYNYMDAMDLIKDVILVETDSLRFIEIKDEFNTELVLFNKNDEYDYIVDEDEEDFEYVLIHKVDYDNCNFENAIHGDKYCVFHWITSYLNSDWALDEIEILGE